MTLHVHVHMQSFIQEFLLGGKLFCMVQHAKHAHLGGSGGIPTRVCHSEIESGVFGHLQYPNIICVQNRFSCMQLK